MSFRRRSAAALSAVALGVLLAAAGTGCGKSKDKAPAGAGTGTAAGTAAPTGPADPRSQAIIDKSKELRDRACACADGACLTAVRSDHDAWLKVQIDEFAKLGEPPSTKAQQDEAARYQRELFECLSKPRGGATQTP